MIKYFLLALTISIVCTNGFQLETQRRESDFKETSNQLINRLVNILRDAFEKGLDTYEKVINDEDVRGILDHLAPLQKKIAMSIINGFRKLLDKIDNATKAEQAYKRGLKESSAQLINKLVNILKTAFEQGREAYEKVINDADVQGILAHLGPLSRKIAESIIQGFKDILDKIDNATKDDAPLNKRDVKESSAKLINKLVQLLRKAFEEGREAYEKVINDEDVQGILAHLGPLSRKVAENVIQGFKDLLDKIDNATKAQSYKRDLKETSASLINKLIKLLKKAFEEGREAYNKVINDEDVKAILNHLGPLSRRVAESIIQGFKDMLEKIDEATGGQTKTYKRGVKESSAQLINKLVQILRNAFKEGREAYEKVINDPDVQGILSHLGPLSRKIADSIIQGFKDLLDKIDNATKSQPQSYKRQVEESSEELIYELVDILKNAFDEGRESYERTLNGEQVKDILSHLDPLSGRFAKAMIQGFKDLLDQIEQATKAESKLYKRDFKETSASLINKLVKLLKKGFEEGREAYEKVLNDEDVQAILKHLGPLSRRVAESIIQGFKDTLEIIDKATNDPQLTYKRGIKESSTQVINKLVNLLKTGFEQGREAYEKVLNDPDVQGILEHLGPLSKKIATTIINSFYDLLDQIDLATKGYVQQ